VARKLQGRGTHIGVLSVHTGDKICETVLLLVLVWDKNGIGVEGALVDLKACFVCNPVAVSEGRCSRMLGSGHIMDGWLVYCAERERRISYVLAIRKLVVVELVRTGQSVGFGPKSRVYVRPGNENEVLDQMNHVWPVNKDAGNFGYSSQLSLKSSRRAPVAGHGSLNLTKHGLTQHESTGHKYTSCKKERESVRCPELWPVGAHNFHLKLERR
jgi:hypothetical protein